MFPLKAPEPNGFPAKNFLHHWDVCGADVTKAMLWIVEGTEPTESINNTILVLISKVPNPTSLSQFRLISLCTILYKIASEVPTNRLKKILPDIIFEEQSTFVPGRMITNNIILAYECLHFMKRNKARKQRSRALKLDMMKSCGRVEWDYLQAIVEKLGFSRQWISIFMGMVGTIFFQLYSLVKEQKILNHHGESVTEILFHPTFSCSQQMTFRGS